MYARPKIDLQPASKTSPYARQRYPKVNFQVERPFLIGALCTFALFTFVHYRLYSAIPPNGIFGSNF
jgi:hypothetical protein